VSLIARVRQVKPIIDLDPGTFKLKARIQFAQRTASDTITAEALQGNPGLKE